MLTMLATHPHPTPSPTPAQAGGIAGFSLTPHQALLAGAVLAVAFVIHLAVKRRRRRRQAQARNARSYRQPSYY